MKLIRKNFSIWKNDIYIIPTFRISTNNPVYAKSLHIEYRNFSIEFHWLVFHARLLFEQSESEEET